MAKTIPPLELQNAVADFVQKFIKGQLNPMAQTTKSNCRSCSKQTNHEVLFETTHGADSSFYNELHTWQVLKCLGCDVIGFRYRLDDFDDVTELPGGKTKHAVSHTRFPHAVAGHHPLDFQHVVPGLIRKVYRQSLAAYAADASILAGIGLRATIEAVCTHLAVTGASLEKRIDALAKGGHISTTDKRRLHAIRFMGNDAAHEVREPRAHELKVALEIVEHLIKSVFILEQRAQNLDVQVESYDAFFKLLERCVTDLASDKDPLSIVAILGRAKRRVNGDIEPFEQRVIQDIEAGKISFLATDSVQEVDGKNVQLYKVDKSALDDDIPF